MFYDIVNKKEVLGRNDCDKIINVVNNLLGKKAHIIIGGDGIVEVREILSTADKNKVIDEINKVLI